MGKLVVNVDRSACIGASMCEVIASQTFEVGRDGVSRTIGIGNDEATLLEAREACPAEAIEVLSDGLPLE